MRIRRYNDSDAPAWDEFCADAPMATFLHSRLFLSYHGERFRDASLVIEGTGGRWQGLFPAALAEDGQTVISHPGSSYGGVIHRGRLLGEAMISALTGICCHLKEQGIARLRYKAVPRIYHRRPADDDLYALFRLGAERYRGDLSCAIDLDDRGTVSERRRRGRRKAEKSGIEVGLDGAALSEFWPVLADNLASRHETEPVHTLAEIELLQSRFPEGIRLVTARQDGAVVAGVLFFCTPVTVHAQYIAASQAGRESSALDAVFEYAIAWAASQGSRYFDFGISNEDDGQVLNKGLYDYKSEFGASGVIHEFYEIDLTRSPICP